jgi:hypothetical protein
VGGGGGLQWLYKGSIGEYAVGNVFYWPQARIYRESKTLLNRIKGSFSTTSSLPEHSSPRTQEGAAVLERFMIKDIYYDITLDKSNLIT